VDPLKQTLEVLSSKAGTWVGLDTHEGLARVRAMPFEAVEIELGALWV
jgi:hypothetical protein